MPTIWVNPNWDAARYRHNQQVGVMGSAALNDAVLAESGRDRRSDGLAAVDDEQPRLLGVQAPLDQIAEQGVTHGLVLGAALPQTQWVLAPLGVDAQSDHDAVLGDQDAVDEDGQQVELTEVASEQLGEFLFGPLDEAPRDG